MIKISPTDLNNFACITRADVFQHIRTFFTLGLADTLRPQNDTTLWEHSYAVSSILKVIAVHNLLRQQGENPIQGFLDVQFGILGIGWDGMRFYSGGHKIGDIVGRKQVIEKIKDKIKELIEYDYPVGNEIYNDDNGIYFIVPMRTPERLEPRWKELESAIYQEAAKISSCELQPHIVHVHETCTLTSIVDAIIQLKKKHRIDLTVRNLDFDSLRKIYVHLRQEKQYAPSVG